MSPPRAPLTSLTPSEFTTTYAVAELADLPSPALLLFREVMEQNLATMLRLAGDPARLRLHCKTHKTDAITRRELELGITRHKCATLSEAEMLATAGATDILWAYNPVGPNLKRLAAYRKRFPQVRIAVTVDSPQGLAMLSQCMVAAGSEVEVLLDLDTGMHRTGTTQQRGAAELYRQIHRAPGVLPVGIHLYDGQNHQTDLGARRAAVLDCWQQACALREELEFEGLTAPTVVAGGTGSFPIFAELDDPALQLSPGTPVFYDAGYSHMFPDLPFLPAALLLTRVVSRPGEDCLTLDLGYKAVASDPPMERRALFPMLPEAQIIGHSEEHLQLTTSRAGEFALGDALLAVPWHVCPTVAMHRELVVVEQGKVVDRWGVTAGGR